MTTANRERQRKPVLVRRHIHEHKTPLPTDADLADIAARLMGSHPKWSPARCMQRARVEWLLGARS